MTVITILDKLDVYLKEIRQKWFWIIGWTILLGSLAFGLAYNEEPSYTATMTYSLVEDSPTIDRTNRSLVGRLQRRMTRQLMKQRRSYIRRLTPIITSRSFIQQVLFQTIAIDGQEDFVANHIIHYYELFRADKLSERNQDLADFKFMKADISQFSIQERKALRRPYRKVVGNIKTGKNAMLLPSYNEDTDILTLSVRSSHPDLSIAILNSTYQLLTIYYRQEESKSNFKKQQILEEDLAKYQKNIPSIQVKLAKLQDASTNILSQTNLLKIKTLTRELHHLEANYKTTLVNLEQVKFDSNNQSPVFSIIDTPSPVIEPDYEYDWIRTPLTGGGIGLVLSILFIVGKKKIAEVLK